MTFKKTINAGEMSKRPMKCNMRIVGKEEMMTNLRTVRVNLEKKTGL